MSLPWCRRSHNNLNLLGHTVLKHWCISIASCKTCHKISSPYRWTRHTSEVKGMPEVLYGVLVCCHNSSVVASRPLSLTIWVWQYSMEPRSHILWIWVYNEAVRSWNCGFGHGRVVVVELLVFGAFAWFRLGWDGRTPRESRSNCTSCRDLTSIYSVVEFILPWSWS